MWAVKLLSTLRGRRRAAVAVAALALVTWLVLAFRVSLLPPRVEGREHQVATAHQLVFVDTPSSQVVDLTPRVGAELTALTARARLLASLILNSPLSNEVEKRAGIAPATLVVEQQKRYGAVSRLPAEIQSGALRPGDRRASVLTANVPLLPGGQTPVIELKTQAPSPDAAARLAGAAVSVLEDHLSQVATAKGLEPDQRIVIRPLNGPQVEVVTEGSHGVLALFGAIAVLVAGLATLIALPARGRRRDLVLVEA